MSEPGDQQHVGWIINKAIARCSSCTKRLFGQYHTVWIYGDGERFERSSNQSLVECTTWRDGDGTEAYRITVVPR